MRKLWVAGVATAAGVILAGGAAFAANSGFTPQPEPVPVETTVSVPVETPAPVEVVTPIPAPEPAPEVVVEAPPPPPALVKCPAGTSATAYDNAGNESGCIPKNNQNQTCQAFNDANECTAWALSDTSRLDTVL